MARADNADHLDSLGTAIALDQSAGLRLSAHGTFWPPAKLVVFRAPQINQALRAFDLTAIELL